MKIKLNSIKIKDIFNGFVDDGEDGVFAYGGKLTIRPPYQREFVYDLKKQENVLHTILKGFPLNTMYWVKTGSDTYEVLDGQQRTLSVMQFLSHKLQITIDGKTYYNDSLPDDMYERLIDYEFMIYICEGSESEKLEWFEVVNIGGEKLTDQELRNAVYAGAWVSDAKRYFSKTGCAAYQFAKDYLNGASIRQEYLETAIKWAASKENKTIEAYMAARQQMASAVALLSVSVV